MKAIITILKNTLGSAFPQRIFFFEFKREVRKKFNEDVLSNLASFDVSFLQLKKLTYWCLCETVHSPLFTLRFYANSVRKTTIRSLRSHVDALQCFQARALMTFSLYYVATNNKSHPHWKTASITRRKKNRFKI